MFQREMEWMAIAVRFAVSLREHSALFAALHKAVQ
jgi:hypothetical protein